MGYFSRVAVVESEHAGEEGVHWGVGGRGAAALVRQVGAVGGAVAFVPGFVARVVTLVVARLALDVWHALLLVRLVAAVAGTVTAS